MLFGLVQIISRLDCQSKFQMFTLFSGRHIEGLYKEVHQHGGSILGFIILRGTFRRLSQLWDNAHTLTLENCLFYLSSIISQFLDFIHRMVLDFIFFTAWQWTHSIWRGWGVQPANHQSQRATNAPIWLAHSLRSNFRVLPQNSGERRV